MPKRTRNNGQVLLIVIGLAATVLVLISYVLQISFLGNSSLVSQFQSQQVFQAAYSSLENSFIRSIRDPSYSFEQLQLFDSLCTINVSGTEAKIFSASCIDTNGFKRNLQSAGTYNGILTINSISEIP